MLCFLPRYLLPFQYPAFRPQMLLLGCWFTWEFHKELSAVYRGYDCAGPQDTYFVGAHLLELSAQSAQPSGTSQNSEGWARASSLCGVPSPSP